MKKHEFVSQQLRDFFYSLNDGSIQESHQRMLSHVIYLEREIDRQALDNDRLRRAIVQRFLADNPLPDTF
jgi:hypothetical protein